MNAIINYLAEVFDEASDDEIIAEINSDRFSTDDAIDFANLIVLLNETSDAVKNAVFDRMNK
jgi:hypothetical protein